MKPDEFLSAQEQAEIEKLVAQQREYTRRADWRCRLRLHRWLDWISVIEGSFEIQDPDSRVRFTGYIEILTTVCSRCGKLRAKTELTQIKQ